ncbi:MAG: endonuclease/exonuclease/phosphatase family protein [Parabacteroides sp.]|nr:endonuclease/exonuclease/phosphatase family protein [Parabacteroides sp.]
MKRISIWWIGLIVCLFCISCTSDKKHELSVLHLNIWMDGTVVENGFEAVVDEIDRVNPDIVMLSEASNRNEELIVPRLLEALREKGKNYFGESSSLDVVLLSKYPILDQTENIPQKDRILRTRLDVEGKQVIAYTGHLDYTHYACYLPRGYSGVTWKKLDAPVTDVMEIEKANSESLRDESIRLLIEDAKKQKADFIVLGGDFNEPSHLDWTEETKGLWDHNGAVVHWDCSTLLYEAGFRDAYRVKYPNPITHPGFTFPSDNPDMPVERLTWAPDADERDRIDFIYYMPSAGWEVQEAIVVGPQSTIVRSERVAEESQDLFSVPTGTWPTDHKGVLIKFSF